MHRDVWIIVEHKNNHVETVTLEILGEGRELANKLNGKMCVCLIGYQVDECIDSLVKYGVEKVYLTDNELLGKYSMDAYAFSLEKLIKKYHPSLIMFGATPLGSELAPRIAARLKLPCITEVGRITINGDNLKITKSGYSDKIYMNFDYFLQQTIVMTILPGEMDIEETNESKEMAVIREDIHIEPDIIRTRNVRFIKGDPKEIGLDQAEIIVAVGRGVGSRGLSIVQEFADVLGASIGGTRLIVDEGIIPTERQIGITGKSIAPKFLIAIGISGAREFTAGIEKATLTVAINTDAEARIFRSADLGLVGDYNDIIPLLIKELRELKRDLAQGEVHT